MAKEPDMQPEQQIFFGNDLPAHDLFQRQIAEVLDKSDLDEEAKQAILVAMNCPCCGAGGMNYTAPLNRKKKAGPAI
jgi:hypothetical protein